MGKNKKARKKKTTVKDLRPKSAKDVVGGRQTSKMDFGDRMKAGLDTAAG